MKKIKIIMISHASMSFFLRDSNKTLKNFIIDDWFSLTAMQIKKYHPELEIECWCPEKTYKTEKEFWHCGMKYRQFPTTFSPTYALDFSAQMIEALKKEVENNKKKGVETILHLHEYHNLHGLVIATLFSKQKIIAQHHGGSWPLKHLRQTKRYRFFFPLFFLGQFWENLVLKNISCFFALSSDEIEYLKKVAPHSRIKFQTMGIEERYFKNIKKEDARRQLKLPQNKKIIIYLGRINYVKGVLYLLKAMEKLKDIDLKVIGYGPQQEEFESYAKSKGLSNVEFVGPVFGDKKFMYLSAADALVLPSSKEGAPVTVMEAMARNRPSIASDVGGVSLMIKNNENGIIIRQKNSEDVVCAIREIVKWKNKNFMDNGKVYKWEKIVDETVGEYLR